MADYAPEQVANFSANLRLMCEQNGSISRVCQRLNVNRQQFSKYLSGLHLPSPRNIRHIADCFGLGVDVLFADQGDFRTLVEGNVIRTMETAWRSEYMSDFVESLVVDTKQESEDLVGVYHRYQYSSLYRGMILRAAFCVLRKDNLLQHHCVERFPSYDDPGRVAYVFKYHGYLVPLDDRIFTIDLERRHRNELTFGIYAPVKRNAKKFMFGIAGGVSGTTFRQPYATKAALHFVGHGRLQRKDLKASTLLAPDDPSIPSEALQFLGTPNEMIQLT